MVGGFVLVENPRRGEKLQGEGFGARRGLGGEVGKLPGDKIAGQGFGGVGVDFFAAEGVGDALELIAPAAPANAGAAQFVESINKIGQKVDAFANERYLKGKFFAGGDDFLFMQRRHDDEGMGQVGGFDGACGWRGVGLWGFEDVGIGATGRQLAIFADAAAGHEAADFFHDVAKPAAQGGAFVFGQLNLFARGEVEGEGGEGKGELRQGGGEVIHGSVQ